MMVSVCHLMGSVLRLAMSFGVGFGSSFCITPDRGIINIKASDLGRNER